MATNVMVSLPDQLLAQVDCVAREEQLSRSELLSKAVHWYVNARRGGWVPGDDPLVRKAVLVQDCLSRIAPGEDQDSSTEVRSWRRIR